MGAKKIAAIVLIAAGTLGLVYRGFSYSHDERAARIGSLEVSVTRHHRVEVPIWVSVGLIVVGTALIAVGGKR